MKALYNFDSYIKLETVDPIDYINLIEETKGKKVNQILLGDFIFQSTEGLNVNHGIYIFKEKGQIKYIGKTSSRPFIERIPAHLDTRVYGWMNTMLKYLSEDTKPLNFNKECLLVLENYELLLLLFKTEECNAEIISKLEKFLIDNTNCLNKKRRKK